MEFHQPRTVQEAIALLRRPSSLAVAGGTSFIGKPKAQHFVDLTDLKLNYIKDKGAEIVIGATTTATDLVRSPALRRLASGILHEAASTLADTPLRNMITVGGNIACKHPWANLPPVFMVLDAKLRLVRRRERVVSIEEFLESGLRRGELISEIIIPKKSEKGKGVFIKFSRTKTDRSVITVAAYAERLRGRISVLRVAVAGITGPTRMKEIERGVVGKEVTGELLEVVTKTAARVRMARSYIFSQEYLRELLGVLLKRAIRGVLEG